MDAVATSAMDSDDVKQTPYVKLISAEGHEFWVDRKCANTSGTIKAMLSGPRGQRPARASRRPPATQRPRAAGQFTESSGEIKFPEISTPILEKVIQYFYYKLRYTNSQVRIPEFQIDPEMALELLMASNFLDC
ncbi:transcription elongation factor B [Aureococcus anophagefferens]|uniref:Elongin-C n=1 Tax=Aureococcus anophagefferens TaxID=44056 RepID=A0ABR1FK62_AURAN